MSGLLIAAPSSGSGKTTITLGLLRAFKRRGLDIHPGKAGPDYIDPAFHSLASGVPCVNFDPWAMRPALLHSQAGHDRMLIEAMMGLFDASTDGYGSPADLAHLLGLSVVLVVDCAKMSHSVGALVRGYMTHRHDIDVAGVILNRVGSTRHETMLRYGLSELEINILGVIGSHPQLALPERHLGLVAAGEHGAIEDFIDFAADVVMAGCNIDALICLSKRKKSPLIMPPARLPPLGSHIAIARDEAFSFIYQHIMEGWREQGAHISFFSPLMDEAPDERADSVYLPGGYPELHAGRLSANHHFRDSLQRLATRGVTIHGECGGYMCLGEALIDSRGKAHAMLGLLPLVTSFARRQRHLGYRKITPLGGRLGGRAMSAHEFHHSTIISEGEGERLFHASDAAGNDLGQVGLAKGSVSGSYMHQIDLLADGT